MKSLLFLFLSLVIVPSTFARTSIFTIDDHDYETNYVEVSPEALPADHYSQLVAMIDSFRFTVLTDEKVSSLFETLKKDRKARNKYALGNCSVRRSYIQNFLRGQKIESGKFYISCPAINGRMRLRDRAANHIYTFANFHDTNIVAVNTPSGRAFRVMDVQFEDKPVSLHDYLAEIEASQRIMPLKRKDASNRLCYWKIVTPAMTYKNSDQ